MKKIIVIPLTLTLIVAIIVPVVVTHYVNRDETLIHRYSPGMHDILSGTVSLEVSLRFDAGEASFSIYFDEELVSSSNSYDLDTTDYNDGPYEIIFNAKEKGKKTTAEIVGVVIDNHIDPPPTDAFKVVNYNIWESGREMIGFLGGVRPQDAWLDVLKEENADIAILVETGFLDNNYNSPLNRAIKILSGYFYKEAPYQGEVEQDIPAATDGEGIISRFPILEFYQIKEYELDDGSMHHYHHDFCDAVVDIAGTVTHFIGYHGKCCQPDPVCNTTLMRENETQGIINYLDDIGDVPVMFLGDFNSFSPEDVGDLAPMGNLGGGSMRMLLTPEDPVYGQYSSKVHNFTDVFRTLNPTEFGPTFGYWETQYWGRIDYILVNDHWADKMINSTVGDTPSANASSDHYAVDCFFSLDEEYSFFGQQMIKESKSQIQIEIEPKKLPEVFKIIYFVIVINPKSVLIV